MKIKTISFLIIFGTIAWGAPGDLDKSFGPDGDGQVITNIDSENGSTDHSYDVIVDPDGRITVTGCSAYGPGESFAVVRYKADGSLDEEFGEDGRAVMSKPGYIGHCARSVSLQADGKIVIAGYIQQDSSSSQNFGLARLQKDGSLDTSFGTGGFVDRSMGGDDIIYDMVIQKNGYIVVVGRSKVAGKSQMALARYNTHGQLDPDFGDHGGVILQDIGDNDAEAYSVFLDKDENIVVAGYSHWFSTDFFTLLRYRPDGSLDETFGENPNFKGMVFTDLGGSGARAKGLTIDSDGKILAAGYTDNGSNYDMAITRYLSDGKLDASFGTGGKVVYNDAAINRGEDINDIAIGRSGKILVAGSYYSNKYAMVARFDDKGNLDKAFAREGIARWFWEGPGNIAYGMAIQNNGKIVVTGKKGYTAYFSTAQLEVEPVLSPIYYLLQ
jgi:uncharacterized delta-60 repeat protein